MSEKECTKCGEVKPFSEYYKMKGGRFGLQAKCKACHCANISNYNKENKDAKREYSRQYYKDNAEVLQARAKNHYQKNKEAKTEYLKQYFKRRSSVDPSFRITLSLRARMGAFFKGTNKSASTIKLLGCNAKHAKQHLENQFTEGMSWDNYGVHGWHIDHIIPCASFDLSDPEQQRKCFHYTNLQPLWAEDNIRKSDKIL